MESLDGDEVRLLKEKEDERKGGLGGFASWFLLVDGLRWILRGWRGWGYWGSWLRRDGIVSDGG